jgi:hypothetical protein
MIRSAPYISDIFVVDEDLRDSELRDCGHAALFLLLHRTSEAPCPVECIKEADNDIAAHSFFHALEAGSATEELF